MAWQRSGDNAATYPPLMAVCGDRRADDRTVNEVAGWLWRCSCQSAGHLTDYVVDVGTAHMLGGARTRELVRLCKKTGLLTEEVAAGTRQYRIVDDPEFMHLRLKKEVEWDRQQRNDARDPGLKVPVLLRDGDNCRYDGVLVQWRGRTSNRTGTLEHLQPGVAGTVATMVVACKRCNSAHQDNAQWADDNPLRPPPKSPLYGAVTAAFLTDNGYPTEPNLLTTDQRPAPAPGADTAPTRVRPATAAGDDPATGARELGDKSDGWSDRTSYAGSGRDGSGVGSSRSDDGSGDIPTQGRRRGRRGSRTTTTASGDGR